MARRKITGWFVPLLVFFFLGATLIGSGTASELNQEDPEYGQYLTENNGDLINNDDEDIKPGDGDLDAEKGVENEIVSEEFYPVTFDIGIMSVVKDSLEITSPATESPVKVQAGYNVEIVYKFETTNQGHPLRVEISVDTAPQKVTKTIDFDKPPASPQTAEITIPSDTIPGEYDVTVKASQSNKLPGQIDNWDVTTVQSNSIIVLDTTPPVLTLPGDIVVEAAGPYGAAVTFTATAIDDVDGSVEVTCDPASGSTFPLGTTTVQCSAEDETGNKATGSFNITVLDTTPPEITVPEDITAEATGPDGAEVTFTASATDLVDGDVEVSYSHEPGANFPIGTTIVTCSAIDTVGNTADKSFKVTVKKRSITVTADALTKVYGNPDPALTYQITSGALIEGDNFAGSLERESGENVGAYAIGQGSLTLGNYYDLTYVGASFTITKKAASVTPADSSKTYGEGDPEELTGTLDGFLAGDNVTATYSREEGEAAGAYAISASLSPESVLSNYKITYNTASFTINARPITITADAQSKVYGDPDPALTHKITSGSLAFDDTFTGALTREAGETVGSYAIEQGSLALSDNYDLTYVGANLTINPKDLTIIADDRTKIYSETVDFAGTEFAADGLINDDAVSSVTLTSEGSAATAAVGSYEIVASDAVGIGLVNYNITYTDGTLWVYYGVNGLLPPYCPPGEGKGIKIGSTIPLKWQYTNQLGNVLDSMNANPSVTAKYIKADNSRLDIEEISSPGSSGLSYHNSSMTWQFNWQTKNLSPGLYEIIIKSKQSGQTDSYPIILRK